MQGRLVAEDLAAHAKVTVADRHYVTGLSSDINFRKWDITNPADEFDFVNFDLVVGCLPSHLGFKALQYAISREANYVDLSFCAEDVSDLQAYAEENHVTCLVDCGLAPGLTNLVVGYMLSRENFKEVHIKVGGFAQDAKRPMKGYSVTWSPEDLYEEYTRPARMISDGSVVTRPALSEVEPVNMGTGLLEAFNSDGLRTLLSYKDRVNHMTEKTLRWRGHAEIVEGMLRVLDKEEWVKWVKEKCTIAEDIVVFQIEFLDDICSRYVTMIDRDDGKTSAMSRTTAFACSAFAQVMLEGKVKNHGIITPEKLGEDREIFCSILSKLSAKGIDFDVSSPFMLESIIDYENED